MVSDKKAIEETKKWFPDLKITIDPALNNVKGSVNTKKIKDIKRILGKVKFPLPTQ